MKKFLLGVVVAVIAISVMVLSARKPTPPSKSEAAVETPASTPSPTPVTVLPVTTTPFVSADAVSLIGNYKEHKTSLDLQSDYKCDYLVNAGFYTKENTPVGYVQSDDTIIGTNKESLLFDGYLTINELGTPRITRNLPQDKAVLALQSGPILIENGKEVELSIKNDKEARRVFALINGQNEILFGIVRSSTLENLPHVIFAWAKENQVKLADAINLDGGSASTYRGPNGVFPEISPIGSAFCIKL